MPLHTSTSLTVDVSAGNSLGNCIVHCLHNSTSTQVPEFRVAYTINTDALDALYKRLKPKGVTMSGLLAKAAGVALSKHPMLYAGQCCRLAPKRCLAHCVLLICCDSSPNLMAWNAYSTAGRICLSHGVLDGCLGLSCMAM